jgi:PAS domain S-box-containing protein
LPEKQLAITIGRDVTERKQAEERLRESEQRWVTTLGSIGDGVIATDVSGKIVFMNEVAQKLTGWTNSAASNKPVKDVFNIVNEQTRLGVENPIAKVLKEGVVVGLANHTVLIRKDGSEVSIDDSGAPIKDKDGKTTGVVLIFRGITEHKKAEEALRLVNEELETRVQERTKEVSSERQRLYSILETLPVYVILLDNDYRTAFANKVFRERFGESNGRRCHEYLFNLNSPCENCETYKVLKTNMPHHWEWTGPDNHNYDIYDFPFVEAYGSTLILEMGIDITDRKKAEAMAQESAKKLKDAERLAAIHSRA